MNPTRLRFSVGEAGQVEVAMSDRRFGDLRIDLPGGELDARRAQLAPVPWTWLRQVHGADVIVVDHPGHGAGVEADAAVTNRPDTTLAIHVADCAPVAFFGPDGVIGAAHAGWRGVLAGVVERTVARMVELGSSRLSAVLGPCIHPADYEFGEADLDRVEARYGSSVRSATDAGAPALDLAAAVEAALRASGVELIARIDGSTADERWFSHRIRGDRGRQALTVRRAELGRNAP